ncbi:hypothetical protein Desdi_1838 [Desulfitobacterium dichloroeliminans LMG P-21439]|uniref:Uncharacterized protein n=1 Tax=Desulfitobacterium dichloroeliminans (strain LMG P-21439 / DCA1) TaxID=871963 RepID=L0F8K4_DESDL|nr:hypothetical protein Desdi_1838 [Desulfitobacterium dichloroeliminans LMG P-21439]
MFKNNIGLSASENDERLIFKKENIIHENF